MWMIIIILKSFHKNADGTLVAVTVTRDTGSCNSRRATMVDVGRSNDDGFFESYFE